MIKKFFIYCKYDGIKSAIKFTLKTIFSHIYSRSETVFFKLDKPLAPPSDQSLIIKAIRLEDIDGINFPRLKLLDCRKWLQSGSKLYIGFVNETPVSFTWTHYNTYQIHGLCHFLLKEKECWIGPTFVHKDFRGKGYNKQQIATQIADSNSERFYTSVNNNNMPSIKSFEHAGFKVIGKTIKTKYFSKSRMKIFGNNDFSTRLKLL